MISKDLVRDEAKRRVLDLVGGHRGGDLALKTMQLVIRHVLAPSADSRQRLHGVLQLIACCNRLERSLADDYTDDKHWRVHAAPIPAPQETVADDAILRRLAQIEAALRVETVPLKVVVAPTVETMPVQLPATVSEPETYRPGPDLDDAEQRALARIMAAAEARQQRLPIDQGSQLIEIAAREAAAMRTARTLDEIEAIRDRVIAFIEQQEAA